MAKFFLLVQDTPGFISGPWRLLEDGPQRQDLIAAGATVGFLEDARPGDFQLARRASGLSADLIIRLAADFTVEPHG